MLRYLKKIYTFYKTCLRGVSKVIGTLKYKVSQCTCKAINQQIDDPSVIKEVLMTQPHYSNKRNFSPSQDISIFYKTQCEPAKLENSTFVDYLMSKTNDSYDKNSINKNETLISEANEYFKVQELRTNKVVLQLK